MYIINLRILGFKSFADDTKVRIDSGLNGIIGPNGSGKSNIVEAIKWVMGESSSKSLRASGMNDLIFNGSTTKPSRNIASVALKIEVNKESISKNNKKYIQSGYIEVEREILRDSGSTYRVNGKEVKAKEIQFLFADLSTGARSCNIIDQGSVGNILTQKPIDRRKILDQAAGISGIAARKIESSNKLAATRRNLERLSDILREQKARLSDLKKQSNRAKTYKENVIKVKELSRRISLGKLGNTQEQLNKLIIQYNTEKKIRTSKSSVLSKLENLASKQNQEKKEIEEEINTNEQKNLFLELKIEKAKFQISNNKQELESLKSLEEQIGKNIVFQNDIFNKANERVKILRQELILGDKQSNSSSLYLAETQLRNYSKILEKKKDYLQSLESKLILEKDLVNKNQYELEANNNNLKNIQAEILSIESFLLQKRNEKKRLKNKNSIAKKILKNEKKLNQLENDYRINFKYLAEFKLDIEKLESEFSSCEKDILLQKEIINTIEKKLSSFLSLGFKNTKDNILKNISIKKEYELAFYLAIGDGIEASKNKQAAVTWCSFSKTKLPEVPENLNTLAKYVKGPKEINNFLSQVAVVDSIKTGNNIHGRLKNGQIAISKDGALWRWDGLFIKDGKKTITHKRISSTTEILKLEKELNIQKKNLQKLQKKKLIKENNIKEKSLELLKLKTKVENNEEIIRVLKLEKQDLNKQEYVNINYFKNIESEIESQEKVLKNKFSEIVKLKSIHKDKSTIIKKVSGVIVDIKKVVSLETKDIDRIKEKFDKEQISFALIKQDHDTQKLKEKKINQEIKDTLIQMENTKNVIVSLNNDKKQVLEKIQINSSKPNYLNNEIYQMSSEIKKNKATVLLMNNKLNDVKRDLDMLNEKCLSLRHKLEGLRDSRIRKETKIEELESFIKLEIERIVSETGENKISIIKGVEDLKSKALNISEIETEIKKIKIKIENIGNVNLEAEEELIKLNSNLQEILAEENDLIKAAKKLEKAIEELNKEARARVKNTFNDISNTFSKLFKKLFDGGKAHLELIDSNDPLEAGLELMVSPPGKKLQRLSLLSGGEKALSSLALIFSTFINKSSPICILDEVDAALDDSNVDKFCKLLMEASQLTKQRFLIVTHNKITMSYMNKIYGITMIEPGVSKLVSVNIDKAESVYAAE